MTTALTKLEKSYPVLYDRASMEALQENLGGETFDTFDLDRVKVPSGTGPMMWALSGDEPVKTLEGIWIRHRVVRAYWKTTFDEGGGGNPPDCFSSDSLFGQGDPGGDCLSCPNAKFGTAHKGSGQACKQMRQVFFLREGHLLPTLLVVPPSSLKPAVSYLMWLTNRSIPYWSVITRMSLEKSRSKGGVDYAQIKFEVGSRLEGDVLEKIKAYKTEIEPALREVSVDDPSAAEAA